MRSHTGALAQYVCLMCGNDEWLLIHERHRDNFDAMFKKTLVFFNAEPMNAEVFMAFQERLTTIPSSLRAPPRETLERWSHLGMRGGLMEVKDNEGKLTLKS